MMVGRSDFIKKITLVKKSLINLFCSFRLLSYPEVSCIQVVQVHTHSHTPVIPSPTGTHQLMPGRREKAEVPLKISNHMPLNVHFLHRESIQALNEKAARGWMSGCCRNRRSLCALRRPRPAQSQFLPSRQDSLCEWRES